MPAAYDNYDYPSYWTNRQYEHQSEVVAIKNLLHKVPKIKRVIEVGCGFGRLVSSYQFRAKRVTLSDPSAKLISMAVRKYSKNKKIEFIQSKLENLLNKKRPSTYDLAIMVRVLHHIEDIDLAFKTIYKLLKNDGFLILEFPNKNHLKASLRHILKGDFTYTMNIFPLDLRSRKHIKNNTLPFYNYNPDLIIQKLKGHDFEIIETLSVSNVRSTFLKKLIPIHILLDIENILQKPLSKINFGPSFFILARKRG